MKSELVIFVIASLASLTPFMQITPAFSAHATPTIIGIIGDCNEINGNLTSSALDANHTQTIDLCEHNGRYFRIATWTDCPRVDAGRSAIDPDTGKESFFSWICEPPVTCDPDYTWLAKGENYQYSYHRQLHVNVEGKSFDIKTVAKGTFCTTEVFFPDQKKITISANGIRGDNGMISVIIPSELLSGDFSLRVDGMDSVYSVSQVADNATITFDLAFDNQTTKTIEILGTEVIPEFGSFAILTVAAALIAIVGLTFVRSGFAPP